MLGNVGRKPGTLGGTHASWKGRLGTEIMGEPITLSSVYAGDMSNIIGDGGCEGVRCEEIMEIKSGGITEEIFIGCVSEVLT